MGVAVRLGHVRFGEAPGVGTILTSAFAAAIEEVEIITAFSPSYRVKTKDLTKPGPPNPLLQRLKPTVILRGPIGTQVIAPAGVASSEEWKRNIAVLGLITGLVYLAGVVSVFGFGARFGARRERRRSAS